MNKVLRILVKVMTVVVIVLISAVILFLDLDRDLFAAMYSIDEPEDGLYTLEYRGDYGLDRMLGSGGVSSEEELTNWLIDHFSLGLYGKIAALRAGKGTGRAGIPSDFACSSIILENKDGGYIWGRNYDWSASDAIIVHTVPDHGYESFGVSCTSFLGDLHPLDSLKDRVLSAASVYACLDGMNEKGLMIAVLVSGDENRAGQNTEKPDLTTSSMIRLVLDRAASVDEAVTLFESYDMHASGAFHFALCDASGRAVVIEYHDDVMAVKETNIVTNFMLTDLCTVENGTPESHERYGILEKVSGPADADDMRAIMMSVAKFNFREKYHHGYRTDWTLVCQPEWLTADVYFNEQYDHCYRVRLKEEKWIMR